MGDGDEVARTTSQVNMMANLTRWVAVAKRDIGKEQLPRFLDIFAIAGAMPPGLKEAIMNLAEIFDERATGNDSADAWSRLILELHGILMGGGRPAFHRNQAITGNGHAGMSEAPHEAAEARQEPIRLKLVLPTRSGLEKEFSVVLDPAPEIQSYGNS